MLSISQRERNYSKCVLIIHTHTQLTHRHKHMRFGLCLSICVYLCTLFLRPIHQGHCIFDCVYLPSYYVLMLAPSLSLSLSVAIVRLHLLFMFRRIFVVATNSDIGSDIDVGSEVDCRER